jgi:flagellin FlaB
MIIYDSVSKEIMRRDKGFSAVEASIVMIAMVVVAAVIGYVVLGAGFFASDKAQTSVQEGTKTAQASVYQEGGLYGTMDPGTGQLDTLSFTIYVAPSGIDQDLSQMTISYTQSDVNNPREYEWSATGADSTHFYSGGKSMLYAGGNQKIDLDNVMGPQSGGWFSIEIRPKRGSSLFLKRYLSSGFDGGAII